MINPPRSSQSMAKSRGSKETMFAVRFLGKACPDAHCAFRAATERPGQDPLDEIAEQRHSAAMSAWRHYHPVETEGVEEYSDPTPCLSVTGESFASHYPDSALLVIVPSAAALPLLIPYCICDECRKVDECCTAKHTIWFELADQVLSSSTTKEDEMLVVADRISNRWKGEFAPRD